MTRALPALLVLHSALLALLTAAPASAAEGGPIDTILLGYYACELPGDATGPAGHRHPEADFWVIAGSSYRTDQGHGAYLLTGSQVTMTSGPMRGARFHQISNGFLRKLNADGTDTELRCIRRTRNNS